MSSQIKENRKAKKIEALAIGKKTNKGTKTAGKTRSQPKRKIRGQYTV